MYNSISIFSSDLMIAIFTCGANLSVRSTKHCEAPMIN